MIARAAFLVCLAFSLVSAQNDTALEACETGACAPLFNAAQQCGINPFSGTAVPTATSDAALASCFCQPTLVSAVSPCASCIEGAGLTSDETAEVDAIVSAISSACGSATASGATSGPTGSAASQAGSSLASIITSAKSAASSVASSVSSSAAAGASSTSRGPASTNMVAAGQYVAAAFAALALVV